MKCVGNVCECIMLLFFFFKQKTAYEMLRSLVGSEMCIRDSNKPTSAFNIAVDITGGVPVEDIACATHKIRTVWPCLLYTSDAADDLLCVDFGSRRIITKKKNKTKYHNFNAKLHVVASYKCTN